MTDSYKEVKNQIWWKKVKGWFGSVGYYILTPAGWVLTTLGAILVALGGASHKGAEKANIYSENKFAEAQQLKEEAEAQKVKDNQKFLKELKKQKEKEVVESDVESDLEDETFVELAV